MLEALFQTGLDVSAQESIHASDLLGVNASSILNWPGLNPRFCLVDQYPEAMSLAKLLRPWLPFRLALCKALHSTT